MGAAFKLNRLANSILSQAGLRVIKDENYQGLVRRYGAILRRLGLENDDVLHQPTFGNAPLAAADQAYLTRNNPRLLDLERRYAALDTAIIDPSMWSSKFTRGSEIDLEHFRGETYVWQHRDFNFPVHYWVTTKYLQSIDSLGLLDKLQEDELFGCYNFTVGNQRVSRDLLDSVSEILFLERVLRISQKPNLQVLDIGAGYGRLAHRLARGLANLDKVFCADAVAESTFLCDYYLRYRGVADKAVVVPLDQLDSRLRGAQISIAVNCHSFSECTLQTVSAWLTALEQHHIQYLLIVPTATMDGGRTLFTIEKAGNSLDILPTLTERGWKRIALQPKYGDSEVQKYGITPTFYHLFARG